MPLTLTDQRPLGDDSQVSAGSDEKCAAPHCRVEDAKPENRLGGPAVHQWFERASNHTRGDRALRIEPTSRCPHSAAWTEIERVPRATRLIVENALIDGAKLFGVEVAIGNSRR